MREPLRLTHFAPRTIPGEELANRVSQFGKNLGYEVQVLHAANSTQADFCFACLRDAAVIVDGSIDLDIEKTVYPVLTAQHNIFDHVLVVSRSYLPLNVRSLRGGGAPDYPRVFTNDRIEAWLTCQLAELRQQVERGQHYQRLPIQKVEDLVDRQVDIRRMMDASFDIDRARRINADQIFISYRSYWFDKGAAAFAERLVENGFAAAGVGPRPVKIVPPGSVVHETEALTPMRRWMLVGLIEDLVRDSSELWLYWRDDPANPGRSYPQSWWTIAELVCVENINLAQLLDEKSPRAPRIKVRVYNADRDELHDLPPDLQVRLSERQFKRLARILSNTRPDSMGPENPLRSGLLKSLFDAGQGEDYLKAMKQFLPMLRQMMEGMFPPDHVQNMFQAFQEMISDPSKFREYMNDEVHTAEFWAGLSVQLGPTSAYRPGVGIDVDTFLDTPMSERISQNEDQLASAATNNSVIQVANSCTQGTMRHVVREQPPRYLWRATRMGVDTGVHAPGLEVLPTYTLENAAHTT